MQLTGLAALATLLCQCAVPIRYAVPTQEVVGREVFHRPVVMLDGREPETHKILVAEVSENDPPIEADMPNADGLLQAAVAARKPPDVVFVIDDTRSWPSIVSASVLGMIGLYAGMAYGLNASDRNQNTQPGTAVLVGTAIGVFAGIALGNALSARIKTVHFEPLPSGASAARRAGEDRAGPLPAAEAGPRAAAPVPLPSAAPKPPAPPPAPADVLEPPPAAPVPAPTSPPAGSP